MHDPARLRRLSTDDLTPSETSAIRALMIDAFGTDEEHGFADSDWDHAIGGVHFVLDVDRTIVAHAAVVEREIHVGDRPFRTGYVEAVATAPDRQGKGLGSLVMTDVGRYICDTFELGALGTGRHTFYERLGWQTWQGPTSVRTADGPQRTAEEDGYILVLSTPTTPSLDLAAPISCDWRSGDVW